jgi:hypothetical protein
VSDYDPRPWDDWDDDLTGPPKEEPDCGACNDNGCRDCRRPSRFRLWWLDLRWRLSPPRRYHDDDFPF